MPNMFIVGTLQGKAFTAKEMYDIFSKTSSRWTKEFDRGLGDSFKGPLVDKAFKLDHNEKTLQFKVGASTDILALAEDYSKRGKFEKAAQIYFALTSDPHAVGNTEDLIGKAYDALLKLYGKDGALATQTVDGKSIYTLIMELANKHKATLELANKKATDLKAAQESKTEELKQVQDDAPALMNAPLFTPKHGVLPISTTGNNTQTTVVEIETAITAPLMPNVSVTLPTTPKSPKIHVEPEVTKSVTPITSFEEKHDAPLATKMATPPVSPTAAPSSPKSKFATLVANNEDKLEVPVTDKITTPLPHMSPTAASSPQLKPITPVANNEDKLEVLVTDKIATPLPHVSPTAATSPILKPITPVANNEEKLEAPVNNKIANTILPANPNAASSSPKSKSVTPVVNNEEKREVPVTDKIATPVTTVSPKPTTSSPKAKPVTSIASVNQHDSALFDANDIPRGQTSPAKSSAPAPTPPRFQRVETLLDNLNAIAAKHPAVGATKAIQDEQKATLISKDKATLSLKDLSYNELAYLTNHMHQVQNHETVDPRFDRLRTEASGGFFKKTVWQEMRTAVKTHMLIQAALQADKAEKDLAIQKAPEAVATTAEISAAPAAVDLAPATNAKFKLTAERHKELATLADQHSGNFFSRVGRTTNTKKFFNAHFEAESEITPSNTSTNTKRM
jgi:hypothetical protein